jgi:membrane associated rhomboid family serine protease
LRKLNAAIDRFAYTHPRFGIPRLMLYVVAGQILVYLLSLFAGYTAISFLTFDLAHLLHGEVWRLVTFIFMPNASHPLSFILLSSFYYFVGTTLEREWGTAKFTLYYLSGMALSVVGTVLAALLSGQYGLVLYNAYYLNLTLFLAYAVLYPDAGIMLYMVIPLKAKWLAWADGALFLWSVVRSVSRGDLVGIVTPIVALLNFLVFFWPELTAFLGIQTHRIRHQSSHQTIQFKSAVKQQRRKESAQGYRHKCAVCGRTDTDFPDLDFRYCSRCAGYHCFCQDHIYNHEHFKE